MGDAERRRLVSAPRAAEIARRRDEDSSLPEVMRAGKLSGLRIGAPLAQLAEQLTLNQ